MISDNRFLDLASNLVQNLRDPTNEAQLDAVTYAGDPVLQIVAGPGSGKTTVLVLRALRFVFVEGILPENILITTFTREAAKELHTRWLDWGTAILAELKDEVNLDRIDLNRCRIDTLDSIIQQTLTDYRSPGKLAPILVETSASNLILRRLAFRQIYEPNKKEIDNLLSRYTLDRKPPRNRGDALGTTRRLLERLVQDRVHLDNYAHSGNAPKLMVEMLNLYRQQAIDTNVFDFTLLEELFLRQLSDGALEEWLAGLRVVLIDEYQDTNPLQEAIYFEMLNNALVAATIVGDDDQSMYRFRGGSVELFTDFAQRCQQATGRQSNRVDMIRNFRSTPEIVKFYNSHIATDPEFASARINPSKPAVSAVRSSGNIPVLGMFRPDEESLARDLASFLNTLVKQRSVHIKDTDQDIRMSREGDLGDIVFLSHSVEEITYQHFGRKVQQRFPWMLRDEMKAHGLQVFNPRGQSLRTIHDVEILLGLVLLSVDFDDTIIQEVLPTNEARHFLKQWRGKAQVFVDSDPLPNDGQGLRGFIQSWQYAAQGQVTDAFPTDWPVLELIFKLITWMPDFQKGPEHQVWLEAITRIVASASIASAYGMQLFQNTSKIDHGVHVHRSRLSLVRDALIPIAQDEVDVDEDIIPSVPRNRLQFMTIHQSKGLEFPLVIVNVGSRFIKSNHWTQRFLRFPNKISNVVQAEDDVEPYLPAPLRNGP